MKFDVILTNPPFQDSVIRKKTPHKLWIDFTLDVFDRLLCPGGSLVQVSPASFASPSNVVLDLMSTNQTHVLRLQTDHHFPLVGSTFSDYWIQKTPNDERPTRIVTAADDFEVELGPKIAYLPNDISRLALSIHSKVMFADRPCLPVEWDYVVGHNIRRHDANPTLVTEEDEDHPFPMFHTNRSTWWSSIRQEWAGGKKVMWTRSGYTKPFYDDGRLGGTDMVYYVRVASDDDGMRLAHNLSTELLQYIFRTARWSGFGNERVFSRLPELPRERALSDDEMYALFDLNEDEVTYVQRSLATTRRKVA